MFKIPLIFRFFSLFFVALILVACSSAQERKVKYLNKAQAYYDNKNYDKARVELSNALQIDPKYPEARYLIGQVAEKRGELRDAFINYQNAVDESPKFSAARAALARLYVMAGALDKATDLVDTGLKDDPQSYELMTIHAAILAQGGNLKDAIEVAEAAHKLAPTDELNVALLASFYKQNNQLDRAVELVSEAIKHLPNSIDLHIVLADLESNLNNLDGAQKQFEEIIKLDPKKLDYRVHLAQFFIFRKDLDGAEMVLRQAIKDLPDLQDAKLALVDFLWSQKSEEEAVKFVTELVSKEPKNGQLKVTLGTYLENQGKVDQAEQIFKEVIQNFGTDGAAFDARNRLAALYLMKRNKPQEASDLIEQVLKENARDNDALIMRANMALQKGDAVTAITDLRSVLRDQPTSVPLMRALAKAHLQNDEPSLAEEALRNALQSNPGDNAARKELAQLLVQQGKPDQARSLLDQLSKEKGGSDLEVLDSQFKAEMLSKDYIAAQKTAEKRQQLRPKEALGWYFAGLVAEGKADKNAARKQFEIALQKQPSGAEPLVALVRMDVQEGKRAQAMQRLEKVLAANPAHAIALNLKGELFLLDKKLLPAELAFRKSVEASPDWWAPYRGVAQVLLAQQRINDAINIYLTGIQKVKKDSGILSTELASLYESVGKPEEAIKVYEQWLQREPKSSLAANNLAMLYLNYKNDKSSLDRLVKLAEIIGNSSDPNLIDTRGWIRYKTGDYSGALTLLQQASKAAPQNRVMKYHLGMAQLKLNNVAEAKANLQAALKDNQPFTGSDEAAKALASISKK